MPVLLQQRAGESLRRKLAVLARRRGWRHQLRPKAHAAGARRCGCRARAPRRCGCARSCAATRRLAARRRRYMAVVEEPQHRGAISPRCGNRRDDGHRRRRPRDLRRVRCGWLCASAGRATAVPRPHGASRRCWAIRPRRWCCRNRSPVRAAAARAAARAKRAEVARTRCAPRRSSASALMAAHARDGAGRARLEPRLAATSVVTLDHRAEQTRARTGRVLLREMTNVILESTVTGIAHLRGDHLVRCSHRFEAYARTCRPAHCRQARRFAGRTLRRPPDAERTAHAGLAAEGEVVRQDQAGTAGASETLWYGPVDAPHRGHLDRRSRADRGALGYSRSSKLPRQQPGWNWPRGLADVPASPGGASPRCATDASSAPTTRSPRQYGSNGRPVTWQA